MARRTTDFQTIRSEGGLLPPDLLRRVIDSKAKLDGTRPEDYGLPQGERLNEVITQSWNRLRRHWTEFRAAAANLPENEPGTGLTNDKWSLPLLRELGFGLLPASAAPEIGGRTYAINRFFGPVPVHLVGCGLSLDRRAAGVRGAAAVNPHGLVQEFVNRSPGHVWAIVSNGLRLRILRDNQALSRQSYIEFDLEAVFAGEVYSDFVLLWLIVHATRFAPREAERPETCWLEQWTKLAEEQGTRALGDLRGGVERALQILGEGFTSHPKNTALRDSLRAGQVKLADFHGQLLRVVYRLIFLFVAEDRTLDGQPLLHPRDDSDAAGTARERYAAHYSTARLRDLASNIKGSRHGDLWRQFQLLVGPLRALRYEGIDLTLGSAAGSLPCGAESDSGKILQRIKLEAVNKGYWRFDDMFAWAERLLAKHPKVAEFARWRFPAVFLDETQDTSELQGSLLNRIFPASACDLRQRFGDSNQAIYDTGQLAATTDPFPASGYQSLPSSQRFGANIAAKVHSMAPDPPSPSLAGEGPRPNLLPGALDPAAMPHTIFLFVPSSAQQVLPAFGSLLLQTFPDEVLRSEPFLARAIGRVGRSQASDEKVPRHFGDYWEAYEPLAAKLEPRPEHLADYVHLAQRRRVATVDCAESIKMVVKGVCELIGMVQPSAIPRGGHTARWLWDALRKDKTSDVSLRGLLWEWCIEAIPIVEGCWTEKVTELRCALGPMLGTNWNANADIFCQWSVKYAGQTSGSNAAGHAPVNLYRFHQDGRYVDVSVGTIHSAKGQTHTATLVVESYFKKHDMEDLLPWLCGKKCGAGSKSGTERTDRMRLVYTAMTRPSHLLCLAMRRNAIGQNGAEPETQRQLEQLGWTVKDLGTREGDP